MTSHRRTHARGFTMIELLVVIGIIILLLAILLPVVGQVRIRASVTNTQGELQRIETACQSYFHDWNAYPGPLSNAMIANPKLNPMPIQGVNGNVTSSENLVLGLLGYLSLSPSSPPPGTPYKVVFTMSAPGQPPTHDVLSLNPIRPASFHYLDFIPEELSPGQASQLLYASGQSMTDSNVPEFVDKIGDPMPILYLRASTGLPAALNGKVAATDGSLQYDPTSLSNYGSSMRLSSGPGQWLMFNDQSLQTLQQQSGIITNGTNNLASDESNTIYNNLENDSSMSDPAHLGYLANPNIANMPRGKDSFILISAGADRTYGTSDDIIVTP